MNEELKVIISAEIQKFKSGIDKAKKQIKDFTKKAADNVKKFSDEFSKVGDAAKKGLAVVGGAVAGAATALLALTSSTAEYRTAQAKLNSAFESVGSSAGQAKTTYNDLFRVIGDSDVAVEAANHLAKLTTNEKHLSEWTNICQGVYATFGDSLPIEGLTEAANETAKVGKLTGSLADALNWAGINEEKFQAQLDACNTEAEREALIRSTLNGVYSGAAANYEKNAAALIAQNEAQSALNDAMARAGEALAPIQTALTNLAAQLLTQLAPYIEKFAAEYMPQITAALAGLGEKIGQVIMWIADNWEMIVNIGTIVLTVAAAISVLSTVLSVVSTVLAIITSPISLVVVGIVALIAAVVAAAVYWDELKVIIKKVVDAVVGWVSSMASKIAGWFSDVKEKVSTTIENLKTTLSEKFEAIKTAISEKIEAAKTAITTTFSNIWTSITTTVSNIKNGITNAFTSIGTTMREKITSAKTTVLSIFDSIKTGISSKIEAAKTTVSNVIEKIKGVFNFSWSLPKLKLPRVSITGKFSLSPLQVPKFSISWNKLGGVFDKPTLFSYGGSLQGLGEDGAEAVVPLERNTEWLDKIADRLASKNANIPIILNVDGKTFAQTSISSINQLTKQTGSLALNLV